MLSFEWTSGLEPCRVSELKVSAIAGKRCSVAFEWTFGLEPCRVSELKVPATAGKGCSVNS